MNDETRRPRPDAGDDEPLEFLNKEPVDMSRRPPRNDYDEDGIQETPSADEAYGEDDYEDERPRRRGLGGGGGTNRVMIATGVVVVAAAAFIFWPRGGGDLPAPVGDQYSVVAEDSGAVTPDRPERPRSSDVNLSLEAPAVVPESPAGSAQTAGDAGAPTTAPPRTDVPARQAAAASGEPGPDGKWAVQLGSFGSRTNAQELAGKLRAKGFRVETPTLQSTTGGAQTKVWIAYFATHAAAKTWAAKHADDIGTSTYITHR